MSDSIFIALQNKLKKLVASFEQTVNNTLVPKFLGTTGHKHTGVDGDAPKLDPTQSLTYVPPNKEGDTYTGTHDFSNATLRLPVGDKYP